MSAVIGVDPGVHGGIAVLDRLGAVIHVQGFAPTWTERELDRAIGIAVEHLILAGGGPAFFEKVGYMPSDGGQGAFTFGQVCGLLKGMLLARGILICPVAPALWQARLDCMSGGNKNVTKNKAKELFPGVPKITHAIADALLIAEFGRRSTC